MAAKFPQLRVELSQAKVDYEFCHDSGKSACLVAKEIDGRFKSYTKNG